MEALRQLLQSLNRAELELLKSSLKFSASGQSKPEKRSIKLIDLLLKSKKVLSDIQISDKIYGKGAPRSKISMLKTRLKEKVLDSLIADINIEKVQNIDGPDVAMLEVRKSLAQFQYLFYSKGNLKATGQLLEEVIQKSKKYELYSVLVEALKYQKWMKGYQQGEKVFAEANKEVVFYDNCNRILNKAADYYYRYIMINDFSSNHSLSKIQSFLTASVSDLKKDLQVIESPIVAYYTKLLEFLLYESKENNVKARSLCLELINIIRNNVSVFRKQRIAIAYDNISKCESKLRNFSNAIEYAQLAQQHTMPGSINYSIAQEHEFYALFYNKQYKAAGALSGSMISSVHDVLGDFRYATYRFYNAYALFAQGKFKEALRILNQHLDLSSDKTGWDIAVRVLAIMCCIELENDKASAMVENLRKHVEYSIKNNHEMKERDSRIVKVLHYLQANGFRYDKTNAKLIANTDLLRSQKSCPWEPFTPELIPFHEWLERKYQLKRTTEKVLVD